MFLRKFWVSFVLSIFVVLYSDILQKLFSFTAREFFGSKYIPFIFGSIIFFYGGLIFLLSAWRELKAKLPGMMTLIALSISAAYFYSVFVTLYGQGETLFWELSTLITIMLLGHWIEMKAVSGAQGALKELAKLIPDSAEIILQDKTKIIPISELKAGDIVLIRPGSRVPVDGIVVEGESYADESMITGESVPVPKKIKSEVIAGTINGDGALKVNVSKIGENTFLAGVMRLVKEAQASKSRLQILSDKAAYYLTLIAITTGGITFIAWIFTPIGGGVGFAMERLVAVLVIACPHALGLAVPLVASISTTMAARNGFLVKKRLSLELARRINIALFDKTGTLTKGEYGVANIWVVGVKDEKELLQLAASADSQSEHFISKAIVKKAKEAGAGLLPIFDFIRIPGKGVKGKINGKDVYVGGAAMLEDLNIKIPGNIKNEIEEENKNGKTIIFAMQGIELLGVFALSDIIREESRLAVSELKKLGVKVAMITGDSENVASWVAKELGIDEYFSKVLPQEKSEKVKILQSRGDVVAMIGDGINDAPALTQADVGIAIGAGTNVAIESSGIILVKNDPRDIARVIKLSRLTYKKMIQNLFWATGYNIIAIPLAAGILASYGILLQPAIAAIFMSASMVIVAINAVMLRNNKL